MKKSTAWFLACRPKTLSVSLSPVLVGTAVAWHDTAALLGLPLLAAALGAALIQIGTNLFNDVGDFLRGTDAAGRLGPKRAAAEGWLTARAIRSGAWLAFALAFACGIYLVWHGGWPIVAIGLASLAAAAEVGPDGAVTGVDINATHLRPARSGWITGTATAIRIGGTLATYDISLTDDAGVQVCAARITVFLRRARPANP